MSEITLVGYEDLRNYILSNWKTVRLMDSNNNEILTLIGGNDAEISISKSGNKILYNIVFSGQKIANLLPKTVAKIGVYKDGGDVVILEALSSPLQIQATSDVVYITLELSIPNLGGAM